MTFSQAHFNLITQNTFQHCLVCFYAFEGQPFPKQLYINILTRLAVRLSGQTSIFRHGVVFFVSKSVLLGIERQIIILTQKPESLVTKNRS